MKRNETGIGSITRFNTDKFISRIGAEVKDYHPENYFSVEEQERYDYCSQFGIIAAKEAMAESGIAITTENAARFGVAFGTCNGELIPWRSKQRLQSLMWIGLRVIRSFSKETISLCISVCRVLSIH